MKDIKYNEGQWFTVPLNVGVYVPGIIVRGSYKTKGGLGYFFRPKVDSIPTEQELSLKTFKEAILISWFSDLGIVQGRWPIIMNNLPFDREKWPIPLFGRKNALIKGKAFIVEYGETISGLFSIVKETPVDEMSITHLPEDGYRGPGIIEKKLMTILEV